MSKPLELVIFDEYHGSYSRRRVIEGVQHVTFHKPHDGKRFTDAELSAEYHAWDAHLKHLRWCEVASGDSLGRKAWQKLNARLETLWWFANLPHYDELQP